MYELLSLYHRYSFCVCYIHRNHCILGMNARNKILDAGEVYRFVRWTCITRTLLWIIADSNVFSTLFLRYFQETIVHVCVLFSEIVFVEGRLNAMGYEAMLHGELLSFIGEIKDKRQFFSETEATLKLSKFPDRIRKFIIRGSYLWKISHNLEKR